jgi:DHA2 family multidrug resistance protein
LQIVLDKGQEDDWFSSNFIIFFAALSALCLVCAFAWIIRQKDPVVDLALLRDKYFGPSCLMIFFVGFTLYGAATLLPLLLQSAFGYDATLAGLVLSPGGIAMIFLMPIVGKLVYKVQAKYLIAFGMTITAIGMLMTSFVTPQTDYQTFVFMRFLQVAGLPFLFIPVSTMAFSTVPKEKSSKASALFSLMRNLGGSFGISILLAFLSRHEQLHQTYLAQNMTPANPGYREALSNATAAIMAHGLPQAAAASAALGRMYQQLVIQAMMLSYGDAFQLLVIITGALTLMALFLPRNKIHKKETGTVPVH